MSLLDNYLFSLTVLGNPAWKWGFAILATFIFFIVAGFLKRFAEKNLYALAKKTKTNVDDYLFEILSTISPIFVLGLSLYTATNIIYLNENVDKVVGQIFILVLFWQLTKWATLIANTLFARYRNIKAGHHDMHGVTAINGLNAITKFVIWFIFLMLALDNLGVDITALVAGLGIGGLALALAAQSILGDLFASLTIMIDKPIALGDYIAVDNFMGTVKSIGIKSTKIESLTGEEIIISNSDLLNSRLRNYHQSRMQKRRTTIALGLVYETNYEKLNSVQSILEKILETSKNTEFIRASFIEFADFSLNFELVYDVLSPDYTQYVQINHQVRLKIFETFEKEGLQFAFPTRTIHLTKDN